jgi:hypothetical protein
MIVLNADEFSLPIFRNAFLLARTGIFLYAYLVWNHIKQHATHTAGFRQQVEARDRTSTSSYRNSLEDNIMTKKTQKSAAGNFIFRKHANIGAADAIDDKKFLAVSFIDNGELDILSSCDQPQ